MSVAIESHLKATPPHVFVRSTEFPSLDVALTLHQNDSVDAFNKNVDRALHALQRREAVLTELADLYPPEEEATL